jgi:hypothetical protein
VLLQILGKIVLVVMSGYAGFLIAFFLGGALSGLIGVALNLDFQAVRTLMHVLPFIIFPIEVGIAYVWLKRKQRKNNATPTMN